MSQPPSYGAPGYGDQFKYPGMQPPPDQYPGVQQPAQYPGIQQPVQPVGMQYAAPAQVTVVTTQAAPPETTSSPTYLWLAILATIFFFPLGIPAILFSRRTDKRNEESDWRGASEASKTTKVLSIAGIVVGVILIVVIIVIVEEVLD